MTQAHLLVGIQFVLFALLGMAVIALPSESSGIVSIAGIALAVIGAVVGLVAIRAHRVSPNVVPTPKADAPLVQDGLYARIRHPIYTGVLLAGIGAGIAHGHPLTLLVAFAFIPFFAYKSTYEERLLRQRYPDYAAYMERTGRFIPPARF